jgi:hypothetical protein
MKGFGIQKYSKILFIASTVLIITLGISGLDYSYSQPILTPTTTSSEAPIQQSINWNQSLILDPANAFCNDDGTCGGIVEVAFESNNTLVLESYNSYRIFDVADMAKNLGGFKIDDVSTTPQDGGIKYLVVMSK